MPAFEPSTWAEVSEAQLSGKSSTQTSDAFVQRVRAFTDAPERFLTSAPSAPPQEPRRVSATSDTRSEEEVKLPAPLVAPRHDTPRANIGNLPRAGVKRHDGLFDDLLGFGRVDVEAQVFVRKGQQREDVEEMSLCPAAARGKEDLHKQSPVNPSSESFDPAIYLDKVHKASSLEELSKGKEVLGKVMERLDGEAERFRRDKYAGAALVEAALEQTKADLYPISPFAKENGWGETERVFESAEGILRARYEQVRGRKMELASLRRTLGVYTRYQWIFGLGATLRSATTEGVPAVENAMRGYLRAQQWIEAQDGAKLTMIEADIADGFEKLVNSLLNRLSTGHFSRQDTARLVGVLATVDRETVLTDALAKRMTFAMDGLRKASDEVEMKSVPKMPATGRRKTKLQSSSPAVTRLSSQVCYTFGDLDECSPDKSGDREP